MFLTLIEVSLYDEGQVCAWLEAAGFRDVEAESVTQVGMSPSASTAAIGLVEGNPVYTAIRERRSEALAEIKAAVITNLAAQLGDHPLRTPLRAHVFSSRRPARDTAGS